MQKAYRAVLLDLFWTTVDLNFELFPQIHVSPTAQGKKVSSSGEILFQELLSFDRQIDRQHFLNTLLTHSKKNYAAELLGKEEEVPSEDKFFTLLTELGLFSHSESALQRQIAKRFTDLHMECIVKATVISAERRKSISALAENYPLGLISNFDHSPAGHRILKDHTLAHLFDTIVISHDLGKRKPHPILFETALAALGIAPEDALMIGDSPYEDIAGAARLSMDTVWIKRPAASWPEDLALQPTYVLSDLKEVFKIPGLRFGPAKTPGFSEK